MDIFALPKEYYALALIGALETIHSVPYIIRGESNLNNALLGPIAVGAGLVSASMYLKQAGIQAGY